MTDCLWVLSEASYYLIDTPQLTDFCTMRIHQGISPENSTEFVEIFRAAHTLNMIDVKKQILEMIANHYSSVIPHLKQLDDKLLLNEILMEVNNLLFERVIVKN